MIRREAELVQPAGPEGDLRTGIQLFQYRAATTELLVLLVVLLAVERVSTLMRSRIV